MKIFLRTFFIFLSTFYYSQQTADFKMVKDYYNQHRRMLKTEFKNQTEKEKNNFTKAAITKDFELFMMKMDSIENVALINTLLKTKNDEDLRLIKSRIPITEIPKEKATSQETKRPKVEQETIATYPKGVNGLKEELAYLFYVDGVYTEVNPVKAEITFTVEKDGSITNVKANGDNHTFNRQAEIAVYLLSEKFTPATINGTPVRYRFRLPLTLNIE